MKCVHCGKELTDDDLFCSQCGKRQKMVVTGGNIGSSAVCEQVTGVQDGSATQPHPEKDISKTAKPFIPVIPKRKLVNWKVFGCIVVVLAVIIGGIYAISEGDLFSESDSKSSSSRRNKDRDRRDDHDYDDYDDYDDYYDDDDNIGYDPQPSYFDCPGCTNGWHDLCDGSGIYRNYGEAVECSCDDGICNQCDGEGVIFY